MPNAPDDDGQVRPFADIPIDWPMTGADAEDTIADLKEMLAEIEKHDEDYDTHPAPDHVRPRGRLAHHPAALRHVHLRARAGRRGRRHRPGGPQR